jgi:hypothetical protein
MRLLRVDIAKGIEISLTVDLRNKFVCSFGIRTIIHQSELRAYTQVVLLKDKSSLSLVYFLNFDCNGQYIASGVKHHQKKKTNPLSWLVHAFQ